MNNNILKFLITLLAFTGILNAGIVSDFPSTWEGFSQACLSGDSNKIELACGVKIKTWLDGAKLETFLGKGWKADTIQIKRKIKLTPFPPYRSGLMLILEITEGSQTTSQVMWWYDDGESWKTVNLPFEMTILPAVIKYPTPDVSPHIKGSQATSN